MNAAQNLTPIQAFFDLAKEGENRWWSWLSGFWFAMVVFIVGQIIITFLLFGFMAALAPDLILDAQSTSEQSDPVKAIIGLLLGVVGFIATALPIALWLMRGSIKSKGARTIAIGLSAFVMIATSAGLIAALQMAGGDNADFGGKVIAAHPALYALVLLTFPPLVLGFWLTVKFVHGRSILSLHTAAKKFRWKRMFFAMLVVWAIAGTLSFIGHITGISKMAFVFDPSRFWMYLPVTLLLIPLQSATEEIALRGYLNQGLGQYIKNPWIVFVITSAAFAALHLGNPEVLEGTKDTHLLIVMSGYFFFGFFACVLTYIDGGLEAAIGMHAANNIFAASIIGYDSSALPTPTVFRVGLNTQIDSITTIIALSLVCLIMFVTRKPLELRETSTSTFD